MVNKSDSKSMNQKGAQHNSKTEKIVTVRPKSGWQLLDFQELLEYRDLFFFLVWREIKIIYAQTILGFTWAILQPLIQIILFAVVFGKVAKIDTDGIPYVLFSTAAIIPWTYMSQAMSQSSQSLVSGQNMLAKIYFPRLLYPITPVLAKLVDFIISLLILVVVMVYYKVYPTLNLLYLPLFLILMISIPLGAGLWLSALAVRFRDVKHAMPFAVRMLMYTAPIVYSASTIPEKYKIIYSLNPIVGVIEGIRACLLGSPIPWSIVGIGICTSTAILVSGALYFKKMERVFVDVL